MINKLCNNSIYIGKNTKISALSVLRNDENTIKIGDRCKIERGAILKCYGGNIELGNDVSINEYSIIYGQGNVKIGNSVLIAAHVSIISENHCFQSRSELIRRQGVSQKGILIGDDVWLGIRSIILDGVHVADGSVIGAGAIVTKDTEPYGIYVGSPARKIGERK